MILYLDKSELKDIKVLIVNGKGNNGGDGWVVGRHLHNCGCFVQIIFLGKEEELKCDALINYQIIKKMNLPITELTSEKDLTLINFKGYDAIVDGIFGTGITLITFIQ